MTRRRAFLLVFGALTVVYLIASTATLFVVRDRLIESIDDDLANSVDSLVTFLEAFDLSPESAAEIDVDFSERALVVVDGREPTLVIAAGTTADPLPLPDLTASAIVARVGEPFQVDAVEGDLEYRVLSTELGDGKFLAVAQPLDALRSALKTLGQALFITLFAVFATLGIVFWLLLRASMRPYNAMVDTAGAIADGHLDRRIPTGVGDPLRDDLADSLNAMLDRIETSFGEKEQAEERLRQFVADASHELRTPLTSISGYSELYLSGAATAPDDVQTQMTRINGEAARLGRMVDDLLALARLDERRTVPREPVDLARVVSEAAADHRVAHPDAALTTTVCDDGVAVVDGDRDALRQVVINLLANTVHHTPAGTPVEVSAGATADRAWVRVRDEGPGMDADTAAHVFDRFYRADKGRARARGNSGLGLSIVAAIVDDHGGTIAVDSSPGNGTTFTIDLPRP
ncbi:MAG: HAMP domain-containing histidine kinase [Ilumatobacter sp.]|nr:HAMP domain-containing histidine kinase [Ilumatobacter sp.]